VGLLAGLQKNVTRVVSKLASFEALPAATQVSVFWKGARVFMSILRGPGSGSSFPGWSGASSRATSWPRALRRCGFRWSRAAPAC